VSAIGGRPLMALPDALLDPAVYPHRPPSVEMRETHISLVFLAGDVAYKVKKALRLPFLDYSTLERRHELCREEVRLNRRLAPDVYLGVRAVVPARDGVRIAPEDAPGAIEYAVEMRRYDEDATLARRGADEAVVRAVGRRLAGFHAEAAVPAEPERAVAALAATLDENFATLGELSGHTRIADAQRMALAVLAGRGEELDQRARSGLVRDGHGDLRAEHVVLEHGIEIVDCVEFDPALREIDVGFDLAFLAMDLTRSDERAAHALIAAYRDAGGDPGDDELVAFFAAQRALIRAKVSLVRAGQVDAADAARRRGEAVALLGLADRLGWRARLGRLAIVCGMAASGKSTLAAALAERAGAVVLSSDRVRKELLGIPPTSRAPDAAYTSEVSRRTYTELGRRARELVAGGERVIVDATFRDAADRRAFDGEGAVWIECRAPDALRVSRAAHRSADAARVSDAGAAIAAGQEWAPLAEVPAGRRVTVRTDRTPQAVVEALGAALDERTAEYGAGRSCLS
jgi:uncharacterized protein